MAKTYIYPYKNGSASAKALAEALGVKQIKREGSKFIPNANKILINWGSSEIPQAIRFNVGSILNHPEHVDGTTNKLKFFRNFLEENEWTVPFTESKVVAEEWLTNGKIVVARTKLTGHSGEGIVLINPGDAIVDAPLYTQYIPKKDEYRVHCVKYDGLGDVYHEVFDIQQKKRKNDLAAGCR